MDLKKMIKVLTNRYEANHKNISLPAPFIVPLFAEPSKDQLEQLKNGDGNPIGEIYQINSSAGLAFNYYKLFECEMQKEHKNFEVKFEDKVAKPLCLKKGGLPVNIDVSYILDNTQYYIESKFLEPYYCVLKPNTNSYKNLDKQGKTLSYNNYQFSVEETKIWLALLEHEKTFKHFDFHQLYRHLLAIRRKHNKQGKVILQSASWKMPEQFKDAYIKVHKLDNKTKEKFYNKFINEFKEITEELEKEEQRCEYLFNYFLKYEIGWKDCSFEIKHYNDREMLNAFANSPKYDEFCKQYFLDKENG